MKLSLKLDEQNQTQTLNPIIFKAKIPIAVFNLPFLSAVTATHHHHHSAAAADTLSLSLRTHFAAGPSLKLSYNTTTAAAAAAATAAPVTVTLKSGVSLSGSPTNSPLIISANFSFSPQNPNPSFLIQFKPQLGSFSFRKSISSVISSKKVNGEDSVNSHNSNNSYGFVSLDRASIWKGLTVETGANGSLLSGVLVAADTELPVGRRVKVGLRWGVGVGVPSGYDKQVPGLPFLRVNKIKVERVDDVDDNAGRKEGSDEFEMLKGMCSWMGRELGDLRNENREMRRTLEEIKLNRSGSSGGFKETKKSGGMTDVESELQKAIKAASSG